MKKIYDIVDTGGFKPGETPADLKLVVTFLDRGMHVAVTDLQGKMLSEGGIDVPTMIGFAKASLLGMPVRVSAPDEPSTPEP